ncbi:hypothetical protein [Planococcus halotolerans]|uniref:Uncharacterized protein n=1 Tax=Planococcus halotolerans TaxID=2233542 RepID=A0A365KTP2_9BACL|nr:hypothetical protein [Planococcus halotolerans]QHJ71593.1 hypothetical protein DNR44_013565 [Planococcus halotolerans]RAZ76550.1 hypothetical protein DP120_10950 [Planococcus halotolerans]
MKFIKNQNGYALLIVLLMVVLFLGLSATFMAGSLSNAKQEKTVDTSNQAVASAEMGVKYFSTDFQKEMELIEEELWRVTQEKVNEIIACAHTTACDEESEILARTDLLNKEMRELYIDLVTNKVNELNSITNTEVSPFSGDPIKYTIVSASDEKLNAAGGPAIDDSDTASIRVNLGMTGTSKEVTKELNAIFKVKVPDSYLDSQELLIVKTIAKENLTYENVFSPVWPSTICTAELLASIAAGNHEGLNECTLGEDQTVSEFIALIKNANLNPADFRVYASDFEDNVCDSNCNTLDFEGIAVVVPPGPGVENNLNNMDSANLVIDGYFAIGNNINNLSGTISTQTIVLRELYTDNNIQNVDNTNLLVLGNATGDNARLYVKNNFSLLNNSKLCIDIDRISKSDLDELAKKITIQNSSYIIYYTSDPANKSFELMKKEGNNYVVDTVRTDLYVQPRDTYANFLSTCGVSLTDTIEELTDLPIPNTLDPDFELDVDYNP